MNAPDLGNENDRPGYRTWTGRAGVGAVVVMSAIATALIVSVLIDLLARLF